MQFIYFLKLFLLIHFSYCKPLINDYPEFYVVVFFFFALKHSLTHVALFQYIHLAVHGVV